MKDIGRNIQIRKTSLKEETDDLKNTTAAERWAMMWQLALDAWAFRGEPLQRTSSAKASPPECLKMQEKSRRLDSEECAD